MFSTYFALKYEINSKEKNGRQQKEIKRKKFRYVPSAQIIRTSD